MTGFPRAGGIRLLRFVLIAVAIGTVINTAGGVVLFLFNGDRVSQINQERARNVTQNCEDVNARNRASLQALDRLLAERSADASPEQIRRSRASTKVLIDTLVPRRDCRALVRQQVNPNP